MISYDLCVDIVSQYHLFEVKVKNNYAILCSLIVLVSNSLTASTVDCYGQDKGKEAILNMAGCYNVSFRFEEVESLDPNYEIKEEVYETKAKELIYLDYADESEISLQHVLFFPGMKIKHWRQVWNKYAEFEFNFKGQNTWKKHSLFSGEWTQRVYQVDDSPRYECSADWIHFENESKWECQTWSPLPRREYTKRNDYQILDRLNTVIVKDNGWSHLQDNTKLKQSNDRQNIYPIAREKGVNTYTKIEDKECAEALSWWEENKRVWYIVQSEWNNIYNSFDVINLKEKVNNKKLWQKLFSFAQTNSKNYDEDYLRKEAKIIIYQWLNILDDHSFNGVRESSL